MTGVTACIAENAAEGRHITAANEGGAVALAAGHYLAAEKPALVYMQNSGLGNALNPLVSLADPLVYGIPVLLLIGWRGEPGVKDEPQHLKQGKVTLPLLETLGLKYAVMPENEGEFSSLLQDAMEYMQNKGKPFALIARKESFAAYSPVARGVSDYPLSREAGLRLILPFLVPSDVVVSTTGKLSREIYEYRAGLKEGHQRDFLNVGSMGHASQIALGIALQKPERSVYCFDGDGAVLMHMGALAIIGNSARPNFKHIVFNNGSHDSVGGQPTVGFAVDFCAVAKACGFKTVLRADSEAEVQEKMEQFVAVGGPSLLEVRVSKGARADLGRPARTPQQNKEDFMEFLRNKMQEKGRKK